MAFVLVTFTIGALAAIGTGVWLMGGLHGLWPFFPKMKRKTSVTLEKSAENSHTNLLPSQPPKDVTNNNLSNLYLLARSHPVGFTEEQCRLLAAATQEIVDDQIEQLVQEVAGETGYDVKELLRRVNLHSKKQLYSRYLLPSIRKHKQQRQVVAARPVLVSSVAAQQRVSSSTTNNVEQPTTSESVIEGQASSMGASLSAIDQTGGNNQSHQFVQQQSPPVIVDGLFEQAANAVQLISTVANTQQQASSTTTASSSSVLSNGDQPSHNVSNNSSKPTITNELPTASKNVELLNERHEPQEAQPSEQAISSTDEQHVATSIPVENCEPEIQQHVEEAGDQQVPVMQVETNIFKQEEELREFERTEQVVAAAATPGPSSRSNFLEPVAEGDEEEPKSEATNLEEDDGIMPQLSESSCSITAAISLPITPQLLSAHQRLLNRSSSQNFVSKRKAPKVRATKSSQLRLDSVKKTPTDKPSSSTTSFSSQSQSSFRANRSPQPSTSNFGSSISRLPAKFNRNVQKTKPALPSTTAPKKDQ